MINLLPELYKLRFSREYHWRVVIMTLIFIDVVIIIGTILLGPVYFAARVQAETAATQAQSIAKKDNLHAGLVAETATLSATLKALSSIPSTALLFTDVMPLISADKTSAISITGINYTLGSKSGTTQSVTLVLTGTATTRNSLAAFISILKNESRISSVTIPISDYAADINVPFTITIIAS